MDKKVILISIDGMRPDGLMNCGNPYVETLLRESTYTLDARTVYPSVTLPCHMSMFHSVPPERHGVTTNTYTPQVRPLPGLFEQLHAAGGIGTMYYGWEPLRDISRPESLKAARYIYSYAFEATDGILTDCMLQDLKVFKPDLIFLYMVETDERGGHDSGWMSETYMQYVSAAIDNVKRVIEAAGEEYTVVITADHGGHERGHGSEMKEDMTIPMVFRGPEFEPGREIHDVSILDIAPTIADVMGIPKAREWEGKSLTAK